MTAPILPLLAALLAPAPAGAAEPAWSQSTQPGSNWVLHSFREPNGDTVSYYCEKTDCTPISPQEVKTSPLYLLERKTHPDVSIPYYEAVTSVYQAHVLYHMVQAGRQGEKIWPQTTRGGALAEGNVVVKWTERVEARPLPLMAERSQNMLCDSRLFYSGYYQRRAGDLLGWQNTRFQPAEIELVSYIGLLRGQQVYDYMGCRDCGGYGTRDDFAAGNAIPITRYASNLRDKVRAEALARRDETPAADPYRGLFTEFEANFLNCRLGHADRQRAFYDAVKAAQGAAGAGDFVARWRRFAKLELDKYVAESEGVRGEIANHRALWDDAVSRAQRAAAGDSLDDIFGVRPPPPPERRPAVGGDEGRRVDDAARRILEGGGGAQDDD